jgi:hypothetical protein
VLEKDTIKKGGSFFHSRKFHIILYGFGLLLLLAGTVFYTQADTVKIFFQNILYFENNDKTEDSSDVLVKQYEVRWNTFTSEIPSETDVTAIALRFSITSNTENQTPITEVSEASSTQPVNTESLIVTDETTQNSTEKNTEEASVEFSESLPPESTTVTESSVTTPESAQNLDEVTAEESQQTPQEEVPPVVESSFDKPLTTQIQSEEPSAPIQVASFEDETPFQEVYMSEVLPLDVVINESSASTTEELEPTTLFEVLYSLDGITWLSVGEGDLRTTQEMTFTLSEIALNDIPNLEIAVLYTTDEATQKNLVFSQMRLEVECVIPEDVVVPTEDYLIDLEPNFEVSAIHADTQSENIRAVLIERGGMLELWYGTIDILSKEISWRQLASDGSIGATTPLQIHERTIFWLDKNQQTLFGFSIDEQSLFGDSLVGDEGNTLALQFSSKSSELWNVFYNPVSNAFEFKREK